MSRIYYRVNQQNLNISIPTPIISGSISYISGHASFSDEWEAAQKFVFFTNESENIVYKILLKNNMFEEGVGLNLSAGIWKTWVIGYVYESGAITRQIPTNIREFNVGASGVVDGANVGISADVGEQVLGVAEDARHTAERALALSEWLNNLYDLGQLTGPAGPQGERGPIGPVGPQGIQGPKGDTGTGLNIVGRVDNSADLENVSIKENASYMVGTVAPFEIWTYDSLSDTFVNQGVLQGPTGIQGPPGESGVYIGDDAPVDPEVKVWIKPSGTGYPQDVLYQAFAYIDASGGIAHVDKGAEDIPVKKLVVGIDPLQSGSGDPSPENVRAISGWTRARVTKTGENLLPVVVRTTTTTGVTYERKADGTVRVYGAVPQSNSSYGYFGVPNSNIKGGSSYVIGGCPPSGSMETYALGIQWRLNGALQFGEWADGEEFTTPFVIPEGATNIELFVRVEAGTALDVIFKPTLLLVDSSIQYASTYDIAFPTEAGVVYGGTLNVTTGLLTVNSAIVRINDASSANYQSEQQRFVLYFGNMNIKNVGNNRSIDGLYAESFFPATSGVNNTMFQAVRDIIIYNNSFVDVESFLAEYGNTKIVIPIATPTTYQLTPTEVKTMLGVNNIWADTGDVDVTYRADPTLIYNELRNAVLASGAV